MGRGKHLQRIVVTCAHCGQTVEVAGSKAKAYAVRGGRVRRFCSKRCYDDSRRKTPPIFVCPNCGKATERRKGASGGYNYKQRFCSRACGNESQISAAGTIHGSGYRHIRVGGVGGRVRAEHRVVMEGMIGRPLEAHETVHHLNGDRADNRRENLELWDSRQPKGQRVVDKLVWCALYLIDHGYHVTPPPAPAPP